MLLEFIFGIILTEAVTEIITKSEIFSPIRKFFFGKKECKFLGKVHDLLDCGYCMSVWVGWFFAILLFRDELLISKYVDWIFVGVILHRLSNVLHNIYDRIYKGTDLNF